ncbi:response regulator transcription factor [Nonomuraea sp. NPDC050783]|uniref:response regulator n=1 Tax=Nonomuraea sp. NPDC050783 TaxID=3154634 RepID=UPI0034678EA8
MPFQWTGNARNRAEQDISASELTVLIVDDDRFFREMAAALLDGQGLVVVGDAADGAAGIEQACRLRPDVVLLDIQLPDLSGFEVCRILVDAGLQVVLCSAREASAYGPLVARSGARGFISKTVLSPQELTRIIES